MSRTNPTHKAPPILGPMDLAGCEGQLILIELEHTQQLQGLFEPSECIVYGPNHIHGAFMLQVQTESILRTVRSIEQTCKDHPKLKLIFLIHEIDRMDLYMNPRERGSIRKGMLTKLHKKALGSNMVIITSSQEEYMLRDICKVHYNLRATE